MNFATDGLDIQFDPEGWGPVGESTAAFDDIPYAHFDKKDRCWRHADFSQQGQSHHNQKAQYGRYRGRDDGRDGNAEFSFKHDAAEDSTFKLVDTSKAQSSRPKHNRRPWQSQPRGGMAGGRGGGRYGRNDATSGPQGGRGQKAKLNARGGRGGGRGGRWNQTRKVDRPPSLAIRGDWDIVEEIDLAQLSKLQVNVPKAEDLLWAGHIDQYDETYDRASTKAPRPLRLVENKRFYSVTTSDDHIMDKFAVENVGNVFATDAILAQLMAASRSVYSWDIVIQKVNGMLFLDTRENSQFDFLTVSETSNDPPAVADDVDEINFPDNLSLEATRINQNMSQQLVRQDREGRKTYEPNPFYEEDGESEPASVAYRYRKFTLGTIELVVRCELHAWVSKRGEEQLMTCHALNEFDSKLCGGVEWRQKIDQQIGAVLATEIKNNAFKMGKWAAEGILAGADVMKLGYVSRVNRTNAYEHTILATQYHKPKDFAQQIAMNLQNMWGVIKMICDLMLSQDDGKYVLMKDPNKPTMRVYSVPLNTFESDQEDEEEDDDEDEDDEDDEDN